MNIFKKIMRREATSLGQPLGIYSGPFLARMNAMATMTAGKGFRQPVRQPRKDARAACNAAEAARQEKAAKKLLSRKGATKARVYAQFGCLAGLV